MDKNQSTFYTPEQFINKLKDKRDFAFLFGNGINIHAYSNDNIKKRNANWITIVKKLWKNHIKRDFAVNLKEDQGISLTEIYDLINIQNKTYNPSSLKEAVIEYFAQHNLSEPTEYHKTLIGALQRWNVPVLTMNFDKNIEDGLDKTILRDSTDSNRKDFTPYYPWNVVSVRNLKDRYELLNTFCVWHINGMLDYKSSIRFGLSDYMGAVERARGLIKGLKTRNEDKFDGKHQNNWKGSNTWLHPFFNKHLCIIGLTLDVNENFLRWLLIERKNYYLKYDDVRHYGGWYVYPNTEKLTTGKKLFLESVGIEPIRMADFDTIYESFLLNPLNFEYK